MRLSFRNYYFRWCKNLLILFLFFSLLLTFARVGFGLYFSDFASLTQDLQQLKAAMLLGLRYDLMPLSYIMTIPFLVLNLAYLIPGKVTIRVARILIISILCLGLCVLGWVYICDYGFYSYFQDHINVLFFGLFEDDTVAVLISMWKNYNLPVWISFVFFIHYAFYRLTKFLFSPYDFDLKVKSFDWRYPFILVFGLAFLAFGARGNFTRLPLSIEDAHISSNEFINKLSVNGPLSLNRAIKIRKTFGSGDYDYLKTYRFSKWQDAYKAVWGESIPGKTVTESLNAKVPYNAKNAQHPPHVILVVMESFGSYWIDHDSANFNILGELKTHFDQGVLFRNFLPSENGTIGSIVSIATSSVIRPGARFLSESEFMHTKISSSGNLAFQKAGYDTHFVYGGKLGWRDLGKFLRVQGVDKLWGADEIKEAMPELRNLSSDELGNEWGIFDEYLYGFIEEQLKTAEKPQFFMVLTTSNHPPFEYPISYAPLPLSISGEDLDKMTLREDLAKKRFIGLQYANQKVGEFISRVKKSNYKDKTIVSLTGDHSFWIAKGVGLSQEFKRYSVPFYLSLPEAYRVGEIDQNAFGSHQDIFPTLYHLALSDVSYVKTGKNILSGEGIAINSSGLVANELGAYHHGQFWKWDNLQQQLLVPTDETPELLKLKKYQEGLISITDLYFKETKE